MNDFDDLEKLRKLSRPIELQADAEPDDDTEEEDLGAVVNDDAMTDQPYNPEGNVNVYVVNGGGSSGTPSKKKPSKPAIFEQEPGEDSADSNAETAMECGLGLKMGGLKLGKSLRNSMECCMDMCDPNCAIKFNVGDYVKPTCCETPVILVVKCTDGSNILTAKPTEDAAQCSETGCWPEFSFEQDEIEPMSEVTLEDIFNVMKFNDSPKTEAFNGGDYDETPMKDAQKGVLNNQRDKKAATFDDINEFMEDVFGPVPDYTVKEKISPDQPEEQTRKFNW
jgi:hypothetical protein